MKTLLAVLACVVAAPAFAAPMAFEGEFVAARHKVTFKTGYDIFSCSEEGGEWYENRGCVFNGENNLSVVKNGDTWLARVSTINANASTCDFVGEARKLSDNVLLASAEGEEFVPGRTSNGGHWIPAICELVITYGADGSVAVKERDLRKCASFCGSTGMLEVKRATRK